MGYAELIAARLGVDEKMKREIGEQNNPGADSFGEDALNWSGEFVAVVDSPTAVILADLDGALTENQLYIGLRERINLIDVPETGLVTQVSNLIAEGVFKDPVTGILTTELLVAADKFTIAPIATNPGDDDSAPFYYLTSPAVVNGKTVAPGMYIKSGHITDLTADKILTGTMTASQSITVGGMILAAGTSTNNGSISLGKTSAADTTNNGFWFGNVAGVPKFKVGNATDTKFILWDGTDLTVRGKLTADDIQSGGTITGNTFKTSTSGKRTVISGSDNTLRLI